MPDRSRTAGVLRTQAQWCARLGSPLYAALLEASARDVEDGGPIWDLLARHVGDPPDTFLPLRFMGAVHRLVLGGEAPALARFYPSAGGEPDATEAWPVFRAVVATARARLDDLVPLPIQTNEVARSAALVGGFLTVARETALPLRLLEIGASAGLNLRWDKYRYESDTQGWGDPGSPLVLRGGFAGALPFDVTADVMERSGCDRAPLDPTSATGRLTLLAYLWPDQRARRVALESALTVAARTPVVVERAAAAPWLEERLAAAVPGVATIVFHSIVMPYLSADDRRRVSGAIRTAGARATQRAPLAWLSMEAGGDEAEVQLTLWPGGTMRVLAACSFHGLPVRWLDPRT